MADSRIVRGSLGAQTRCVSHPGWTLYLIVWVCVSTTRCLSFPGALTDLNCTGRGGWNCSWNSCTWLQNKGSAPQNHHNIPTHKASAWAETKCQKQPNLQQKSGCSISSKSGAAVRIEPNCQWESDKLVQKALVRIKPHQSMIIPATEPGSLPSGPSIVGSDNTRSSAQESAFACSSGRLKPRRSLSFQSANNFFDTFFAVAK
jgi:hypothetical protein